VSIQEHSHHTDRISTYYINKNVLGENSEKDITSKGDIVIENDVWIGAHCVVLSGAHISTGAIVAANSVVTGFVPPYAIVGGSPAKVIKYRFNQDTINTLLKSAWWEWSVEKIKAHKELFNLSLSTPEAIQDLQNILSTK
jgi:acetyltransferase-like isoleucine patch superfamily enzyme